MGLKKNDLIELEITACAMDGSGIGRHEGLAVFVPGAAAGDTVSAHILSVKSNHAYAKIDKILTPSPDRIEADCPVYARCGGCAFRHIRYEAELAVKRDHIRQAFKRIGKIDVEPEPVASPSGPGRYRNKAMYALRQEAGALKIGFYAPRSHRVADCRDCLLQPADFKAILDVFAGWMAANAVTVYDEATREGLMRGIFIRRAQATGETMTCAVVNGKGIPHADRLIAALLDAAPGIASVAVNLNTRDTNVVLGEKTVILYGKPAITDELCGLKFVISPASFYQVNHAGASHLIERAREYAGLSGAETVLDLYCGAGAIGLAMAASAKEVIGVETVDAAVRDARENAALNSIANARFLCADAAEAAARLKSEGVSPDVIILDPPRKGCEPAVLQTAADMNPRRIVYVSCDPATLARDCAVLDAYGYRVQKVSPVDMFPRTGHCEVVVSLRHNFASR